MARGKKDDEQGDNEGGQYGGESSGHGETGAPQSASFEHVKAELVQLENEINSAIRINEIGERSEVDQVLTTMQRRLREVNKAV